MVWVLKQIPECPLVSSTHPLAKVLQTLVLDAVLGQVPLGSVVGVLAAGLEVEIIKAPVSSNNKNTQDISNITKYSSSSQ